MNFSPSQLGQKIQQHCPEVLFALLHGSAKDGCVKPGSDIDVALFLRERPSWDIISRVMDHVEALAPGIRADVGILNEAEPVYRFEALKGTLLFTRDEDAYLSFFSLTCREYEEQMASYDRQRRYRLEAIRACQ